MVNIDPKRIAKEGREVWDVHINGGRIPTGLEAVAWAREVERLGAGEIVLTSMDADGTQNGYDIEITRKTSRDAVHNSSCCQRNGMADWRSTYMMSLTERQSQRTTLTQPVSFTTGLIPGIRLPSASWRNGGNTAALVS